MRFCPALLLLCGLGWLAGCQTGEVKAVLPLADGNQITMPIATPPPRGEGGGYHVDQAMVMPPTANHELCYGFGVVADKTPALRRIQIDDVTDEAIVPLIDDQSPKFNGNKWEAKTDLMGPEDPRLKWIFQITGSMRVYRFTLTPSDGPSVSFYHVVPYAPVVKAVIRNALGEKY